MFEIKPQITIPNAEWEKIVQVLSTPCTDSMKERFLGKIYPNLFGITGEQAFAKAKAMADKKQALPAYENNDTGEAWRGKKHTGFVNAGAPVPKIEITSQIEPKPAFVECGSELTPSNDVYKCPATGEWLDPATGVRWCNSGQAAQYFGVPMGSWNALQEKHGIRKHRGAGEMNKLGVYYNVAEVLAAKSVRYDGRKKGGVAPDYRAEKFEAGI